jgi:hypothetical protein
MYLLVAGNQPVRTAEVISTQQGTFAFAAISSGQAAGLAQAIATAEAAPDTASAPYEMRMVQIPALYVTALWLKAQNGPTDYFIAIPPAPDGFRPYAMIDAKDFLKLLQAKATERVRLSGVQTPGTSPTN